MDMNQFRGVKPTGNLGAVARKEVEDLLNQELQPYPDKGEVTQMIQTQAPAPDLSAYATIEQVEALDPLPKGGTNGQVLARAGRDSAEWVPAPGTSIRSVSATSDGKMRVILSDGSVSDIPVKLESAWSKDAQAKVQGYWEVVSEQEPAEKTYTTRDGVTVPIKWTKPFTQIVPVFPEPPAWDDYEQKVLVPDLVGVTYQFVGGSAIPGGEWADIPGEPPFDVTVEAVAAPGYQLIAASRWTHSVPSATEEIVVTSDSFDRANANGAGLGSTDATLGGTPVPWEFTSSAKATDTSGLVKIDGGKLRFSPFSVLGNENQGGAASVSLSGAPENWRLEFDLAEYTNVIHGQALQISYTGYAANFGLNLYIHGGVRRLVASWFDAEQGKSVTETVLSGVSLGKYTIEKYRHTLSVSSPDGQRSISLSGHDPAAIKPPKITLFRQHNGATYLRDTQQVALDNLKLTKIGF